MENTTIEVPFKQMWGSLGPISKYNFTFNAKIICTLKNAYIFSFLHDAVFLLTFHSVSVETSLGGLA